MEAPVPDPAAREHLRAELEGLEGVRRAVIDGPPFTIYLICQQGEPAPVEMLVRPVLARHGIDPAAAEVQISFLPSPQPPRRVRFLQARLERPAVGRAVATVSVEWEGQVFESEIQGEPGEGVELRLSALTTLRTVEAVIRGAMRFRLVGIRSIRAFDTDLVVVLLHTEHSGEPLVGAAVARESPHHSAAVAVLNATNRVLGNYLVTTD
ncbi:MAG TPA: hypothetical protein VHG28_20690 [Longimicrobiaceae bacterium]|nr:hypothetical protein [Longimicrobiaceae bacterium]